MDKRRKKPPKPGVKPPPVKRPRPAPGQVVPNPKYDLNMDGIIQTLEQRKTAYPA